MDSFPLFEEFPKLPRLSRNCVITEKLDGTNAQVCITEDGQLFTGSRTQWITPERDNYGFAGWAQRNRDELLRLGPGRHFGEWWGNGIQRKYGLAEKRFSLFNTPRWTKADAVLPACVSLVPILYEGIFTIDAVNAALEHLRAFGSVAAPGFQNPEGVVVFHVAGQVAFKKTLHKDDVPKGHQPALAAGHAP